MELGIFALVWFDGISTIACYLMPKPFYTYILNIRQIHLPRKQRRINRKGHRTEVNESRDSYQ